MRHYALYDHRWIEIHRPEPVPGLLLELQPRRFTGGSSTPRLSIPAIASAVVPGWCVSMAPWCAAGVQKKTCV